MTLQNCLRVLVSGIFASLLSVMMHSPAFAQQDPDADLLREALESSLQETTPHIDVLSLSVTAQRSGGDFVNPIVQQRFVMEHRTSLDLYTLSETVAGVNVLGLATPAGGSLTLFGVATWELERGEWKISDIYWENTDEIWDFGAALSFWIDNRAPVVIAGSPEEAAFRAELQAEHEAKEAARRAEIQRVADLYGGEWISLGRCGNIDFEHRFQIEPGEQPGQFTGQVTYRPIYPSPPFELGSYELSARHDPRQERFVISHGRWIERPSGNSSVSINLTLEGEGPDAVLVGQSSNLLGTFAGGNCQYRLLRPEAYAAEREATLGPVRALLARLETGVWMDGSQTGPERDGKNDWPVRVRINSFTDDYILATAELTAFHSNSRNVLGDMELNFAVFLVNGLDKVRIEFGRRPAVRGRDVRNLYSRSNFCPSLSVDIDPEAGVLHGTHGDRQGCIEALRFPLIP